MVRLSSASAQSSSFLAHDGLCLVRRALFFVAVLPVIASVPPRADPILQPAGTSTSTVTFPFTVQVTTAFGPLDILFGRSFTEGDTLSGRIVFDGTSGPDQDPWTAHGMYTVPSARLELDVPSGFALDARSVDRFNAETFNNVPGTSDELIFYAYTCCHSSGIGFVNVDVLWTDPLNEALTGDALPTDPQALRRFRRVAFGLLADDNPEQRIALFGEAPLKPVPEPASVLLVGAGLVGVLSRRRMTHSLGRNSP